MSALRAISIGLAAACLSMYGAGCQTVGNDDSTAEPDVENTGAPNASADSGDWPAAGAPPRDVRDALLPPVEMPEPGPLDGRPEPRFDVAVNDAPARSFFLNLFEDTPYDVIVHPAVEGRLSLSLRDATVPEILDALGEVYGYQYRPTATGFHVLPPGLQSRIFNVNYLHVSREGTSQTRVSSGQLSDQFQGSQSTVPVIGPTTTGGARAPNVLENTKVRTNSNADLWGELTASVRQIIGEGDGRSVVTSPQTGIVVVRAMPQELRQVQDYLRQLESNISRQVILDAKILEVVLDEGFQSGVNWAALIEWAGNSILISQTGGGSLLASGISEIAGNSGILDPSDPDPPSNSNTSAFGGIISGNFDFGDFTAFVELLETQGDVHVLSSPRVSVVNNQKAVIKLGQDEFFVTDVSTVTVTGTATTTSPNVTLTPFFSGVALDVLPQISPEGDVVLHIHPSISRVEDDIKTIQVGEDSLTLPLALSTIRETDTIVRAKSGQVVVIGGLMQDTLRYANAFVPLLGRIPYLGALFSQRKSEWRKSELVILLRPQVVEDGTWRKETERTRRRFDEGFGEEALRLLDENGWHSGP